MNVSNARLEMSNRNMLVVLVGLIWCSIALPSLAQRQLSLALQAFTAKDYPAYMAAAPGELAGVMERPHAAFEAMLPATIALEKTAGWDGETEKQIAALFAASPDAMRWWEVCKLLVQGDTNGLDKLFDGPPPSPYALTAGARLAREHGFALVADCLTAVSPDMPGLRVKAWLSIPQDKRAAVDTVMEQQVAPINLRMLAEAALNFYIDPPKDLGPIPPEELLAFAKKYANGLDVVSFKTAERLVQTRKIDAGLAMAGEVAALAPADLETQRYTARLFWGNQRFDDTARLFWQATENVPAPNTRGARLCYLSSLELSPPQVSISSPTRRAALARWFAWESAPRPVEATAFAYLREPEHSPLVTPQNRGSVGMRLCLIIRSPIALPTSPIPPPSLP